MTISDKLALLEQTKEAQRIKLGLPESVPFSQYVKFMQAWTPAELFANGEQGVWFDPSDLTTMFQDVDGLEPVTKDGDPVALIKDKSGNGNHATQPTASARPIYRTDGILHWLEGDGVDDYMATQDFGLKHPVFMGVSASLSRETGGFVDGTAAAANTAGFICRNSKVRVYSGGFPEVFNPKAIVQNTAFVATGQHNGNNSYTTVNNNPPYITPTAPNTMGGVTIMGLSRAAGSSSLKGRLYGIVTVSGVVSDDIRESTNDYLASKSGVTL